MTDKGNARKSILLVEDDLFVRELYQRVLSEAGFKVITAENGTEGLKLAETKPDLILLDIMLPEMDGITVLSKLKRNAATSQIPVILLTNLGQENIIKKAFKMGAKGYLVKMHFSPYEIVNEVKNFFDQAGK